MYFSMINTINNTNTHWGCSGVFIVNFEHISHLALVFLLFEHVFANWKGLEGTLT